MSRLGDLENAIISRLAAATWQGGPLFQTVTGLSGGHRSSIRDLLRRQRLPAAFVAFTEEATSPRTQELSRGARFVVLVAAGALRAGSDPRHDDVDAVGAFTLLEQTRTHLDDYVPVSGVRAVNQQQRFVEADDRLAIYELLYLLWPVSDALLRFNGEAIAGSSGRLVLEAGPIEHDEWSYTFPGLDGSYRQLIGVRPRNIFWRGQLRASSDQALNAIESDIEVILVDQNLGDVTDGTGRVFYNCTLEKFTPDGPRRSEQDGQVLVQDVELKFVQSWW